MCKFGYAKRIIGKDGSPKLSVWKCGKCSECLAERRKDLVQRAYLECLRVSDIAYSLKHWTFTYDNEHLEQMKACHCAQKDFAKFMKRLRKFVSHMVPNYPPIRLMRVAELGEDDTRSHRLHWHVIFFNIPYIHPRDMKKLWRNGNCYVTLVRKKEKAINYVTKYVTKGSFADAEKKLYGIKRSVVCSVNCGVGVLNDCQKNMLSKTLLLNIGDYKYKLSSYLCKKLFENAETNSVHYCQYINKKLSNKNYVIRKETEDLEESAQDWLRHSRSDIEFSLRLFALVNTYRRRCERLDSENAYFERNCERFRLFGRQLPNGRFEIVRIYKKLWI